MHFKSLLFTLLVSAVFTTSCTNSSKEVQSPQVNSKVLTGVWEYRNRIGGMVPYTPDECKPGNGNLWIFTQTNFQSIYKDSVNRSGIYSISPGTGTDENTGRKVDQFIFNDVPADFFELRDDTLRFYYGFIPADGDILMYVKIADDTTGYSLH